MTSFSLLDDPDGTQNGIESDSAKLTEKPPVDVTISRPKLISLYKRTVEITINASCSNLQLLYDKLECCIRSFQNVWHRNPLLEKIELLLIDYEERNSKTNQLKECNSFYLNLPPSETVVFEVGESDGGECSLPQM